MNEQLSRRTALLAIGGTIGIAAVPIAAVAKIEHDSASRRAWDRALAAYRHADAEMRDYDRDYLTPAGDAYAAVRDQWPVHHDWQNDPAAKLAIDEASALYDPVQEHFDELVSNQGNACHYLLSMPAIDGEALVVKLELVVSDRLYEMDDCSIFEVIRDDARRLAAGMFNR